MSAIHWRFDRRQREILFVGTDETARATAAEYRRMHPSQSSVIIVDKTAVLTFYVPALGLENGVRSSDIFVYRGGRWHALYSQHSTL